MGTVFGLKRFGTGKVRPVQKIVIKKKYSTIEVLPQKKILASPGGEGLVVTCVQVSTTIFGKPRVQVPCTVVRRYHPVRTLAITSALLHTFS
jgi:hypothetical protein